MNQTLVTRYAHPIQPCYLGIINPGEFGKKEDRVLRMKSSLFKGGPMVIDHSENGCTHSSASGYEGNKV